MIDQAIWPIMNENVGRLTAGGENLLAFSALSVAVNLINQYRILFIDLSSNACGTVLEDLIFERHQALLTLTIRHMILH